jgi:ankyrin repeat protein
LPSAERNNVLETFHQVTLLHVAAERGNDEVVKLLLSKNHPVDDVCERKGRDIMVTALHLACYNGRTETAKVLIEGGANINQSGTWIESLYLTAKKPTLKIEQM